MKIKSKILIPRQDLNDEGEIIDPRTDLVNKLIDLYKTIKKSFIISSIPNKFYCFAGYYIERLNPGKFQSILYEKSKQKINQYNNLKKEVDELIKDINSEYKYFKEEIDDLF